MPSRSNSSRLLLGPLAGVFVGLLLGWVLFGRTDPAPRASVAPARTVSEEPAGEALASSEAVTPRASESSSQRRVEQANPGLGSASEERLFASLEPASDDSILAVAVTGEGAPLEGVRFTLAPQSRTSSEPVQEATTGAGGSIEFQVPSTGRYQLTAVHPQFELEGPPDRRGRVVPGMEVVFRGTRLVPVRVEVLGPDGRPPAEAFLKVHSGVLSLRRWTPENPVCGFPQGHHVLQALIEPRAWARDAMDLAAARSESQTVYVQRNQEPEQVVRFVCEPDTYLIGQIVRPAGTKQYQVARVYLRACEPGEPVDEQKLREGDGLTAQLDGLFEFSQLRPGFYWVGYSEGFRGPLVISETLELTQGENLHDLVVPTSGEEAWLRARVSDPDMRPVRDVRFTLSKESPTDLWEMGLSQRVEADGSYRLALTPTVDEELSTADPEAEFTLELSHPLFGNAQIVLEPGQREVEHEYFSPASLSVEIAGLPAGLKRSDLKVELHRQQDGHRRLGAKFDSETGLFGLDQIRQGTNDLMVWSSDWRLLVYRKITVVEGHNQVAVQIPTLFEVQVEAPNAPVDNRLVLRSESGVGDTESGFTLTEISAWVDESGFATFDLLHAGSYLLTTSDEGQGMILSVPGGPYRFEPQPTDSWKVTIRDPDGLLAKSGFQNGDLILSVDEQPFSPTGTLNPLSLLRGSRETPVQFEVLRDAGTLTIAIEPDPTLDRFELGGQFQLWPSGL